MSRILLENIPKPSRWHWLGLIANGLMLESVDIPLRSDGFDPIYFVHVVNVHVVLM